jgi:hypothetical protein
VYVTYTCTVHAVYTHAENTDFLTPRDGIADSDCVIRLWLGRDIWTRRSGRTWRYNLGATLSQPNIYLYCIRYYRCDVVHPKARKSVILDAPRVYKCMLYDNQIIVLCGIYNVKNSIRCQTNFSRYTVLIVM